MDTSLGNCSVALWEGEAVVGSLEEDATQSQSKNLIPMVEKLLAQQGVEYKDLDAIACTIGPGGFTGIRVGLTSARILSLVAGKPFIGLSTLETIAFQSGIRGDVLAVIDAYRGQFYVQRFRVADTMVTASAPMLVDAKLVASLAHGAKKAQSLPGAKSVAALAYQKWKNGERTFPSAPLYIREPDAKLPAAS
jgi:tRNA threonylcarbamoyl adenosine modification protein YeaZ